MAHLSVGPASSKPVFLGGLIPFWIRNSVLDKPARGGIVLQNHVILAPVDSSEILCSSVVFNKGRRREGTEAARRESSHYDMRTGDWR
jgi:hypothetical protein